MSSSQLTFIFFRGVETTNQKPCQELGSSMVRSLKPLKKGERRSSRSNDPAAMEKLDETGTDHFTAGPWGGEVIGICQLFLREEGIEL